MTDLEEVKEVMNPIAEVREIEKDEHRNGRFMVEVTHESNTLPNERIRQMAEKGYIVSCVVGGWEGNESVAVYFEEVKASF